MTQSEAQQQTDPPAKSLPKIGIIGGGQLGKMLAEAAHTVGLEVELYDPDPHCCSTQVAAVRQGDFNDLAALQAFSDAVDLLTFEFENIPASILSLLDRTKLFPSAQALSVSQDRLKEKELFARLSIPTTRCKAVSSGRELHAALLELGYPAILKTRSLGYDGKGQCRILSEADLPKAEALIYQEQIKAGRSSDIKSDINSGINSGINSDIDAEGLPCLLEELISFKREFSIIAARDINGEILFYPLTENCHLDGILLYSVAPVISPVASPLFFSQEMPQDGSADKSLMQSFAGFASGGVAVTDAQMQQEKGITDRTAPEDLPTYHRLNSEARKLITKLLVEFDYRGVLTLELFESQSGVLLANEIAPRVHNSGHWTMDVAPSIGSENRRYQLPSQFLAHMICVAGLSLKSVAVQEREVIKDGNDRSVHHDQMQDDDTIYAEAQQTGTASNQSSLWHGMLNLVGTLPELKTLNSIIHHRLHPHIYGKPERARRKLGHLNLAAASYQELIQELEALAQACYPRGEW